MRANRRVLLLVLLVSMAEGLAAQDVEMFGRRYGTRPPDGYFREIERNPDAYRFSRGRAARERSVGTTRSRVNGPAGVGGAGGPALALGPRGNPVTGTFRVPVVLGLFSDSPAPPYDQPTVQTAFFDAPTGTVREYYAEVSLGQLTLLGETRPWVRASMTQAAVTQNQSGLVCCGIGSYIKQVLALQSGVNWGLYDNDGPDGVPNSGDDDGYVDALAVMHPTRGAECGGTGSAGRIWSHKWTLSSASGSGSYATATQAATNTSGVPYIVVEDYFVQGVVSCDGTSLSEIGIFTHETGHAFGLPDLYDTRQSGARHNGAGNWDLMATGSYGCNGNATNRPCHMGAWSKAMLGWANVTVLPAGTDFGTLTLPPVETSGAVYLVDAADGSGEYFLLENRQQIGYDQGIFAEGLLVWQIDDAAVQSRWASNFVNGSNHMGVWLRQADGCDDLGRTGSPPSGCDTPGTRGDAGDPFPGQFGNTAFHASSNPASVSFKGTPTGVTVVGIAPQGADDVSFRLLTRFSRVGVASTGTTPGATGLFTVDGAALPDPPSNSVLSAPFQLRTIEAAPGEIISVGQRSVFDKWLDAPSEPRTRVLVTPLVDSTYVAHFGATQYQLALTLTGGVDGVVPGVIQTTPASPDLWFAPATSVQVAATAGTGFAFTGWSGGLASQPNPATVVMNAPVTAGANFQLIYSVATARLGLTATLGQSVQLVASNGTSPVTWSKVTGSLPTGISLSSLGLLSGTPLDVGGYPIVVRAVDGRGLSASATVTLDVAEPSLTLSQLTSRFLLSGPPLEAVQEAFLDRQGNRVGGYDLGDLRAWVLAHPSLPLATAVVPSATEPRTLELPMQLQARSESR